MKTITVDILQDEALNLLKDLEALKVIRLHDAKEEIIVSENLSSKYKGAMSKQSREEIEQQLHDLRNEWN
jgi:hypothetical protein